MTVPAALAAATIEAALTVAARAAAGGDQMGWQMRWRRPTVEPLFNGEIWDGDATWSSMTAGSTGGGWRRWQRWQWLLEKRLWGDEVHW